MATKIFTSKNLTAGAIAIGGVYLAYTFFKGNDQESSDSTNITVQGDTILERLTEGLRNVGGGDNGVNNGGVGDNKKSLKQQLIESDTGDGEFEGQTDILGTTIDTIFDTVGIGKGSPINEFKNFLTDNYDAENPTFTEQAAIIGVIDNETKKGRGLLKQGFSIPVYETIRPATSSQPAVKGPLIGAAVENTRDFTTDIYFIEDMQNQIIMERKKAYNEVKASVPKTIRGTYNRFAIEGFY